MQNRQESGEPPWTILRILRWTTSHFRSRHIENPRASAEILLAHALGIRRIDLYLRHDQPLMPEERERFRELIRRRLRHEPVAYIVGRRGFWTLELSLSPAVLIPRPETECLVEAALECLPRNPENRILDLGTGSGAIILSLAAERPENRFYASDRSPAALEIAKANAAGNGLEGKIHFFCGDWFAPLCPEIPGFDLIVSNPPYIRSAEIRDLQPEISFEPKAALDGGPDGLAEIRQIVGQARNYLAADGFLIMEIGCDQAGEVVRMAEKCGAYDQIRCTADYSARDRVVQMRRKAEKRLAHCEAI
ncbi:MAG: peptide chain release factor N(5)-glutamine methyltransferase [Desulfobacterales bacterium]